MGDPPADWKVQDRHALDWVVVAVVLGLVGGYLYLGSVEELSLYFGVAVALVAWLVLFFSRYWQTILYLPAIVLVSAVTAVWILRGTWAREPAIAVISLNAVLLAVTSYLLFAEEPAM